MLLRNIYYNFSVLPVVHDFGKGVSVRKAGKYWSVYQV